MSKEHDQVYFTKYQAIPFLFTSLLVCSMLNIKKLHIESYWKKKKTV